MSSPAEEEARRLAEAVEAQDTEGTEAVAVQANETVEEQGTEASTVEVEAESSFESIDEDQGVVTVSSTESEEQGNPVPQPEPTQAPNVPRPEQEPLKQPTVPQLEPSPVTPMPQNTPKMSKEAPEPEPFMPKVPKMGRLVQVSATTYVAKLGNVPNPEFSGLLDEGKGQYALTEQQQSMLAKYDNPKRRTDGLLPLFDEKQNLPEFAEKFNQDLFETGSAVTAHLPNLRDHAKPQLNVLKQHALFTNLTEARMLAEEQYKKFDEYDVRTDRENVKNLRSSLEPKLRQTIDGLILTKRRASPLFSTGSSWLTLYRSTRSRTSKGSRSRLKNSSRRPFRERTSPSTERRFSTSPNCSQTLVSTHKSSHRPSSTSC
jgi:hypothetical protein